MGDVAQEGVVSVPKMSANAVETAGLGDGDDERTAIDRRSQDEAKPRSCGYTCSST